jgi:hypothetical protein
VEQKILEDCYRLRRPLPKAIREAPQLELGLEFTYQAFWELNTCRPTGWTLGSIPWTAIHDYAKAHGMKYGEEFEDFSYLIRAMDRAFLDINKPPDPKNKAPGSGQQSS